MLEIVRTKYESSNKADFVAIGNLIIGAESVHSAFIIQYESKVYELHYTGSIIEYGENLKDYYHLKTCVIHKDEVPAFIAQCKNILKHANPIYGYFYSGQSYDLAGNHLCNSDLGEIMTCAGFCLNVLKGFLEEDYLAYADWDHAPYPHPDYVDSFCRKHNLDISKLKASHRRITPRECLISCNFEALPIRKAQIDGLQPQVQAYFDQLANQNAV